MEPWACPSSGCNYRGTASIHLLDVMQRNYRGHMTAGELSLAIETVHREEREQASLNTTVLQAEIPVSLFEGQTVDDIEQRIFYKTYNIVTHSERFTVVRHDGEIVLRSPPALVPQVPVATLTIRWEDDTVPDRLHFWDLLRSWEAITKASEVRLDFPGGIEVILKDRKRNPTSRTFVPVRVSRPHELPDV